ncbi:hypothetical protein EGT07_23800 [Herbaspirillum sp. HC18]|nr:hypothetical protein EGT07_23800 [Herbaspirillum sp. HC18]
MHRIMTLSLEQIFPSVVLKGGWEKSQPLFTLRRWEQVMQAETAFSIPGIEPKDLVAGWDCGTITMGGRPVGICVKFSTYDGGETLIHFAQHQFDRLMGQTADYLMNGKHTRFFLRAENDPELVASLHPDHPYHAMLHKQPPLVESEVGNALRKTTLKHAGYVDQGEIYLLKFSFADSHRRELRMHEYTAFSFWRYMVEYCKAADILIRPIPGLPH